MKENKSFWDRYASDFDSIYETRNSWFNNTINKYFRGCMKIRFEKTMQIIPEQDTSIIDIGCGPGHYCYSLGQVGNRKILGIDFSERMIEIAQDHVKDSVGIRDLKFEVVNFLDYEPGKKFDYSIMMGFIEYFKNPELVILKALGITGKKILISFPVAGGGYFRLFPKSIFLKMANVLKKTGRPLVFYIHPRDLDTNQPQIHFSFLKKIRHYINISKTEQKLDEITGHFDFKSFEMMMSDVSFMGKLTHSSIIK
jgi:SAM-dependent methyltransferase